MSQPNSLPAFSRVDDYLSVWADPISTAVVDGAACLVCGSEVGLMVPCGLTARGQLFCHPECAEPECAEVS